MTDAATDLWAIVYQLSIGATGFVLASEVATLKLRAVTQSLVTMSNGVWGLIMQFTIPYMVCLQSFPRSNVILLILYR